MIDRSNGIDTSIPTTLEEAIVIIGQLKAQLANLRTEDSQYNLGRHAGYAEGYADGKEVAANKAFNVGFEAGRKSAYDSIVR